jgi:hypothetical protein
VKKGRRNKTTEKSPDKSKNSVYNRSTPMTNEVQKKKKKRK